MLIKKRGKDRKKARNIELSKCTKNLNKRKHLFEMGRL